MIKKLLFSSVGDLLMRIRNIIFPYIIFIILQIHVLTYPDTPGNEDCLLIGNENLLVGIKNDGSISFSRWHGVGGSNHIGHYYDTSQQITDNKPLLEPTAFLLQVQDSLYYLTGSHNNLVQGKYTKPEIPLLEFEGRTENKEITWQQEVFVHPTRDIICIRFNFNTNLQEDINEYFISYQDISPKPLPIPENAFLNSIDQFQKDFCVFWDKILQTLVYFRPYKAGISDLHRLQQIKSSSDIPQKFWRKFEEGVYIGISSINPIKGTNIFVCPMLDTQLSHIASQGFPTNLHTFDDFSSSLVIEPTKAVNHTKEIHLFYIFASNYSEMEKTIQWLKTQDYSRVKEDFYSHWKTKWDIARENIKENIASNWLKLYLCSEATTGAILTQPFDPILGNQISLRDSFLLIQSIKDMNMTDFSKKMVLFWFKIGKERNNTSKQTFPLRVYPDGTPACPDYWADITQTSYFISMVDSLMDNMNFQEKKDFLNEIWDVLVWGINNLCLWRIPGDLLPAPSFMEILNRDSQTANLLINTIIGIQKGLQLAKTIYQPIPEFWETRDRELQTWIRLAILKKEALEIFPNKESPYWKKVFPSNHIIWQIPVKYNGSIILLKDIN